MRYAQHHGRVGRGKSSNSSRFILFPVILLLLGGGLGFAVSRGSSRPAPPDLPMTGEETDDTASSTPPTEPAVPSASEILAALVPSAAHAEESVESEVDLSYLGEGSGSGFVRRGTSSLNVTYTIVANLPGIDQSREHYEVWLVKPGVVEFFSIGDVFPREDGKWGFTWTKAMDDLRDDVLDFRRVIVTKESNDGNTSPSAVHILEGEFIP